MCTLIFKIVLTHFCKIRYKSIPPLVMNLSLQNSSNEKEIHFTISLL
jgi:hypothetical protein